MLPAAVLADSSSNRRKSLQFALLSQQSRTRFSPPRAAWCLHGLEIPTLRKVSEFCQKWQSCCHHSAMRFSRRTSPSRHTAMRVRFPRSCFGHSAMHILAAIRVAAANRASVFLVCQRPSSKSLGPAGVAGSSECGLANLVPAAFEVHSLSSLNAEEEAQTVEVVSCQCKLELHC